MEKLDPRKYVSILSWCIYHEVIECRFPSLCRRFEIGFDIAPRFEKHKHACTVKRVSLSIISPREKASDYIRQIIMPERSHDTLHHSVFRVIRLVWKPSIFWS